MKEVYERKQKEDHSRMGERYLQCRIIIIFFFFEKAIWYEEALLRYMSTEQKYL